MSSSSSVAKPSLAQRQVHKAATLAKNDVGAVANLASSAVQSGAYFYPLKGILYFLSHPKLFESVKPIVYKSAVMSAGVLVAMFFLTYLPQVAMLALVSGPLAFIAAIPVVLTESWVLITFLNKALLVSSVSDKIFDAVLVQQGYSDLVEKGRTVRGTGSSVLLGKSILKPIGSKFSTAGLVRYILTLPLNAIPGVGTAFFLGYNGSHAGPAYHSRYFALKSWSSTQQRAFVEARRGAYTSFGAMSLLLGLIPVAGTLFSFTSAAGAALWAADLERAERGGKKGGTPAGDKKDVVQVGNLGTGRDEL